jgi:hypothetical protein
MDCAVLTSGVAVMDGIIKRVALAGAVADSMTECTLDKGHCAILPAKRKCA